MDHGHICERVEKSPTEDDFNGAQMVDLLDPTAFLDCPKWSVVHACHSYEHCYIIAEGLWIELFTRDG